MRICPVPDDETPRIVGDESRRQVAITFDAHREMSVFFCGVMALSRKRPWPVGHVGADFVAKAIAVDAPSPLEFPMELFPGREVGASTGKGGKTASRDPSETPATRGSRRPVTEGSAAKDSETEKNRMMLVWIGAGVALVILAFLYAAHLRAARSRS
jgi:hypothetical protein